MSQLPKILCLDDEDSILQSLSRVFKSHFEVLTANQPQKALEMLRENKDCAVILTDYKMPEMTGIEFLRASRKLVPEAARAILSGQIEMDQLSEAINTADIHKFMMKPWENDRLLLHMLEALQIHATLTEKGYYQKLAITDPVTQLTNHRFFQDQLREELIGAKQNDSAVNLIMIDVDNFKSFNDRFGHPEGDRLLFNVAERIKRIVGERGHISRYGGEEFSVIVSQVGLNEARDLAETIRVGFEKTPLAGLSTTMYITLSMGLSRYPDHGRTPQELIDLADRALYQAKRQGRNQLVIAATKVS